MKRTFTLSTFILVVITLFSQGTVEDYQRAFGLNKQLSNKVFNANITPSWIGSTSSFWYISQNADGKTYLLVDAQKKTRKELFDHKKLALELSEATDKSINPRDLTLADLRVSHHDTLHFAFDNHNWTYAVRGNQLENKGAIRRRGSQRYWGSVDDERRGRPANSPDKKYAAFTRDNNIWLRNILTDEEEQLTTDGTTDHYYSAYMSWSPNAERIAVMKVQAVETPLLQLLESSPNDQMRPKLHTRDYRRPGDPLPQKTPVIIDIITGSVKIASSELFNSQYWMRGFDWSADSKTALFEFNQRGHQAYRVLEISAETADIRAIIDETSTTFVNYGRYYNRKLTNGTEIIWMSERDNWNHLYLYDRNTGKVKNQITKGEWYVREVIHVDEKSREIIFSANGMVPNEDPYLVRYYRIRFDGSGLTCLTPERGMHRAWFSDNKKFLVDVYSNVDEAPTTVLRDATNGKIILALEKATTDELQKAGWIAPETFVAKGRDGKTDIWGIIHRPTNFDPTKKYPVIEYIYAGPGSHYTPKNFITFNHNMSALAELGFIVIQLDGMGTSFRSKSFEDVIHKNLKDAGFPDRIAWTRAAAEEYPYMDIERIGIFGASAGGQAAMWAVLFHPEHYKAAYGSCGCHDNRMDKIWWNEQWMGYPIGEEYAACSNVDNAHLLTRPLMLVVGEMDDNVDPASTYQVANALIKAKKDFELVTLPGVGHTMGGEYGEHKRFDFFVKHLMNVNPPAWGDVK